MEIKWTKQAFQAFQNIKSNRFTLQETKEYKKRLVKKIDKKIPLLGTSIPVQDHHGWEGSYKVNIDNFVVYYSFSPDKKTCYIEYFKHFRQEK